MFASPPDQALEWNDDAVAGALRFLRRWWVLVHRHTAVHCAIISKPYQRQAGRVTCPIKAALDLRRTTHTLLSKAVRDYQRLQYNTVVAGMMELLNALDRFDPEAGPECGQAFFGKPDYSQ